MIETYFCIVIMLISFVFYMLFCIRHHETMTNMSRNTEKWPADLKNRFVVYQQTMNDNAYQYDLRRVQDQATPDEVEFLLQNNHWPWPEPVKQMYLDMISRNRLLRVDPYWSLHQAMKTYNATAMLQLLAMSEKEGAFLLHPTSTNKQEVKDKDKQDIVQCRNGQLIQSVYDKERSKQSMSFNGLPWFHQRVVPNEEIPSVVDGFAFEGEPCNPCSVLPNEKGVVNTSCKFRVHGKPPGKAWEYIWFGDDDNTNTNQQ